MDFIFNSASILNKCRSRGSLRKGDFDEPVYSFHEKVGWQGRNGFIGTPDAPTIQTPSSNAWVRVVSLPLFNNRSNGSHLQREPGGPGLDSETWETTEAEEKQALKGHDFSPAEEKHEASGHNFSRADKTQNDEGALAPEGKLGKEEISGAGVIVKFLNL